MGAEITHSRRKERRFKTCDRRPLRCCVFVDFDEPVEGTVIDISASGLRLLCDNRVEIGKAFLTELKTDRLHGVFPGLIRRVQPWVDGKSVLGCQLLETIPDDVLAALARQGVLNRRDHDRIEWQHAAKMSWELKSGEVDVEIQNCSLGGLCIFSTTPIPNDILLRIRAEISDEEQMVVDAKTCWQREHEQGFLAGLAFTNNHVPEVIKRILEKDGDGIEPADEANRQPRNWRRGFLVAAAILVVALAAFQTSLY